MSKNYINNIKSNNKSNSNKTNYNKYIKDLYEVESFLNSIIKTSNVFCLYSAIKKNSNS